eukprot:5041959-Prymnesium_polylepis.1
MARPMRPQLVPPLPRSRQLTAQTRPMPPWPTMRPSCSEPHALGRCGSSPPSRRMPNSPSKRR